MSKLIFSARLRLPSATGDHAKHIHCLRASFAPDSPEYFQIRLVSAYSACRPRINLYVDIDSDSHLPLNSTRQSRSQPRPSTADRQGASGHNTSPRTSCVSGVATGFPNRNMSLPCLNLGVLGLRIVLRALVTAAWVQPQDCRARTINAGSNSKCPLSSYLTVTL